MSEQEMTLPNWQPRSAKRTIKASSRAACASCVPRRQLSTTLAAQAFSCVAMLSASAGGASMGSMSSTRPKREDRIRYPFD
jgi:uncharacterized protein YfiM (DUF2279 family)